MKIPSARFGVVAACIFFTLGVTGCATKRPAVSREESLAMSSRVFPRSKEQTLEAAQKVLSLSDGDDYQFQHSAAGFSAQRQWSVYLVLAAVMGTDFWAVRTSGVVDETRVELEVGTSAQGLTPMATTSPGTYSVGTLPSNAALVQGPALYELFFARMEYLLGLRADWPSCDWSDGRVKIGAAWGSNEALCNSFNVKDKTPSGPL